MMEARNLKPLGVPASAISNSQRGTKGFWSSGYALATIQIVIATGCLWLLRGYVDKGQASLLYLPIVIVCAARFGFGSAVWGAVLSFFCWDFFFLPPRYSLIVEDPKDWLSLVVFLVAAITIAQLAAHARDQSEQARAREVEILTLYQASEAVSHELQPARLLPVLSQQLQALCNVSECVIFERDPERNGVRLRSELGALEAGDSSPELVAYMARAALDHNQVIGFGESRTLWSKAALSFSPDVSDDQLSGMGVFVPLHAEDRLVGVLHVGARKDKLPYSALEERLILTLANHVAVVLAKQELSDAAAQTAALRDADELKDVLLSMVTHELRTPLASIKGTASSLLHPGIVLTDDMVRPALESINSQTDRLTTLVSNLLDLSRLQAGVWKPDKDWCDIIEILGTALDQINPAAAARVRVDAPQDLPLMRVDYVQIALALRNLLENAAKYAPDESPIVVNIQLAREALQSSHAVKQFLLLSVRDFGEGLSEAETERIFNRFYRGAKHQNSVVHGTGLGLALCQAVITAHGGVIIAGNAPEGEPSGAVFTIRLPLL